MKLIWDFTGNFCIVPNIAAKIVGELLNVVRNGAFCFAELHVTTNFCQDFVTGEAKSNG